MKEGLKGLYSVMFLAVFGGLAALFMYPEAGSAEPDPTRPDPAISDPAKPDHMVSSDSGINRFIAYGSGIYGEAQALVMTDDSRENIVEIQLIEDASSPGYGNSLLVSPAWLDRLGEQPLFPPRSTGVDYKRRVKNIDGVTGASLAIKAASRFNQAFRQSISEFAGGGLELTPLELDLGPDAITRATPGYPREQVKPPHLRAEIRRPAFLVASSPRLLSVGKPVTSSMEFEPIIGELEQITDGIKTCTEFDYVELDAGPQWIQIDLEQTEDIYLVIVWHFYKNPVIYRDVIVQVSDDEEFRQGVMTIYNNDHDNSSGEGAGKDSAYYARWWGEFADARGASYRGTRGRYVRVHTNGGTGMEDTRFVEVEVYGK